MDFAQTMKDWRRIHIANDIYCNNWIWNDFSWLSRRRDNVDFDEVFSVVVKILLIIIEACVATLGICLAITLVRYVMTGGY